MSVPGCDDARALLELEPLDLLAPDERAALDAHCAACAACATERQALRSAHGALSSEVEPPSAEARERFLFAAFAAPMLGTAVQEVDVGPATKKRAILDGAAVDAARVEAVGRRVALGCSYCHARAARDEVVFCAACLAPHHAECFRAHGRCSLPGCEETLTVRAGGLARAPTSRARWAVRGLVLGLAAVGTVAAWQEAENSRAVRRAQEASLERALVGDPPAGRDASRVSVEAREAPLREVTVRLAVQAGRSVLVDPAIQETVTLSLRDVPFEDAVHAVARQARCRVELLGDGVWSITQPPRVTLQFTEADVRSVLQHLATHSAKNILIDADVRGTVTQDLKEVDWDLALVTIAHAVDTRAWAVGDALIYVGGSPPPGATAFEPRTRRPSVGAWVGAADADPIDLDLKDATPAEACARVAAAAGRAIELQGAPDPDRRVTLRLRAVSWPAALGLVAQSADCDVEPVAAGAILRPIARLSLVRGGPVKLGTLASILGAVERGAGRSLDLVIPADVCARRAAVDLVDVRPREALVAWAQAAGCQVSSAPSGPTIAAVSTPATPGTWTTDRVDYSAADPRLEAVVLGRGGAWAVINDRPYRLGQPLVDPASGEDVEGSEVLSITKDGVRLRLPGGERSFEVPRPRPR
jgi:hypothetical protein